MKILPPCIITPRLMAGVRVGDGFISIDYSPDPSRQAGRTRYFYAIDVAGQSFEGSDLESGCMGGDLQGGLHSLLSFLCAAAEGYSYRMRMREPLSDPDEGSFPEWVAEWAYQNEDDLSMMALDLEEIPGIINELEG